LYEKWITSISEIYNLILNDSLDNAGLNLGSPWQTVMKVRYAKKPPFPYITYEYRDYRALLASDEPSEYELFGLYKSLELQISYTSPE
jgi:hypothetical protein